MGYKILKDEIFGPALRVSWTGGHVLNMSYDSRITWNIASETETLNIFQTLPASIRLGSVFNGGKNISFLFGNGVIC